jgi:hypothetical protein
MCSGAESSLYVKHHQTYKGDALQIENVKFDQIKYIEYC